jgi:hypothetical protein
MKRVAVIAAVLAVAACKGKEMPSADSIAKAAPAAAATMDTAMKKMDTAMKMADTAMKKMDTAMKKMAAPPAPAPAKKP